MYEYMMLCGLSFKFCKDSNNVYYLNVSLEKRPDLRTIFNVRKDGSFLLKSSTMSAENKYKSIAIVERNKNSLFEGMKRWVSTQKSE